MVEDRQSQSGSGSAPPEIPPSVPGLSSSAAHSPTSSSVTENDGMPKMKNLKVLSLIEFDTFVATHGPGKYVEELAGSKRKLSALSEEPSKQQKFLYLAYFNPVLAHVVAMSDEKLPFVALDSSRWSAGGNERHFVGAETVDLPQPKAPLVPVSFNGFASRSKHGSRSQSTSKSVADGYTHDLFR